MPTMKGTNVTRALILAVSCLILGFVGGWTAANIGSDTVTLPEAKVDTTVASTTTTATSDTTDTTATGTTSTSTTGTGTGTGTSTATTSTTTTVSRSEVTVSVLNASGVAGRAGQTATSLKGKGWADVATGNLEPQTGTTVYYRAGSETAAAEIGTDLSITRVTPLAGSPVESAVNASADVIVVLGS